MKVFQKCDELINLISSKISYQKYFEECEDWKILYEYQSYKKFPEFYALIKSYHSDEFVILDKITNKFKLIHFTYDYDPKTGEYDNKKYSILQTFSTPEQVWQELIKPDIEEYYGIVIEE